jgi:putative endonuclease
LERLVAVVLPHADKRSFDSVTASLRDAVTPLRMTEVMREHRYSVYIVASRTGTLYIGMTGSLDRRVLQQAGEIEGFASKYHCDRLVYYESFDDVYRAIGREKQLKGWARAKKIALIESQNPRWEDLAEKFGARMAFAGESIKGR